MKSEDRKVSCAKWSCMPENYYCTGKKTIIPGTDNASVNQYIRQTRQLQVAGVQCE